MYISLSQLCCQVLQIYYRFGQVSFVLVNAMMYDCVILLLQSTHVKGV